MCVLYTSIVKYCIIYSYHQFWLILDYKLIRLRTMGQYHEVSQVVFINLDTASQ